MKLTPKPIAVTDEIDQSRDISGFNKWARSSRTIGFIMLILGWFTIPAEVLLRRDFGQRWFTAVNYFAGFFLLLLFTLLQYVLNPVFEWIQNAIIQIQTALNPSYEPEGPSLNEHGVSKSMMFFLLLYTCLGAYHLFKIWWRNRADAALHSFDDGTSRLEPVGRFLAKPINKVGQPCLLLCMRLLPKKLRQVKSKPVLISDPSTFTNIVLEPFLLFLLAWWCSGITSLWLFITTIAVLIHANWKETARLNKVLDFRDSVIEAKVMMEIKEGILQPNAQGRIMQQAAKEIKANPQVAPQVAQRYSNLMSIIEEMNADGTHLAG